MQAAIRTRAIEPMIEMDTTPLIDVMLVLLIMFIITIPPATHTVELDLPQGKPPLIVNPMKNKVVITADSRILWNGMAVDRATLRRQLAASARMTPVPELHLQPEAGARYEVVDHVLADTKMTDVKKMGFVGNEQYRHF